MKARAIKFLVIALLSFGAAFCVFSLLSPERIPLALPLAVFAAFVTFNGHARNCMKRVGEWVEGHQTAFFGVAVVLSLIGRLAIWHWMGHDDLVDFNLSYTDSRRFWEYAQEMAGGSFPPVKSWTTAGAYAGIIACFGKSTLAALCLNFVCQIVTAACLYVGGKTVFSRLTGIVSAGLYLVSPPILLVTMRTMSENFYFMFLAVALCSLALWFRSGRSRWLLLSEAATWLCTWSRGEGVLLLCATFLILVSMLLVDLRDWRIMGRAILVYLFGACAGAAVGLIVNASANGTRTVFCSADNYWPKLIGARIETKGQLPTDKRMPNDKAIIRCQYLADHPGDPDGVIRKMRPQTCPAELVPYIQREISRRWAAMSFCEAVGFILTKELFDWSNSYTGRGRLGKKPKLGRARLFGCFHVVVLVFACIAFVRAGMAVFAGVAVDRRLLLSLTPFVFLCGVISILAIFEANIRYGLVACVLLPFYAAGGALAQLSRE